MRLLISCFILSITSILADDATDREAAQFALRIKDVVWDLRGTFGLKRLCFDGKEVRELKLSGETGGAYEFAFPDTGVMRLNFKGANTGWYFFSDDRRFVTPLTVSGEVVFKAPMAHTPKVVHAFPEDVTGVVFDSEPDERQLQPARLRWNGAQIELAKQNRDKTWLVDKFTPVNAGRRVLECDVPGVGPFWFAFSHDGKEAWMLQIENVFGGEAGSLRVKPAVAPAIPPLTAPQAEAAAHVARLRDVADKTRADALERHLRRQLVNKPDALRALNNYLTSARP